MANKFLEIALTPSVLAAQTKYFGQPRPVPTAAARDPLGPDEMEFIRTRDSFYMATVMENGWPYVQHRGGLPGFLHIRDSHTLAFADYKGNRQLITTGNMAVDGRVAFFLMDYPRQLRLKILGHGRVEDARHHPELVIELAAPPIHRIVERLVLIDVTSFDWNCSQYITPRYTTDEIEELTKPLKQRIEELEAQLQARDVERR